MFLHSRNSLVLAKFKKKPRIIITQASNMSTGTLLKYNDMGKRFDIRAIFRYMMEEGYYPRYEKTYILFDIEDNTAVVEYEEDIISIRIFFSIDEDAYDLFLEASNAAMLESFMVKPAILDDMKNIMFSYEMCCDTVRDLKKFFPRGIRRLKEAMKLHKAEMKKLIIAENVSSATITAAEDTFISASKAVKPLS